MQATLVTIEFLRSVFQAMQQDTSRYRLDVFADRLSRAASAPTLTQAMEQLVGGVDASPQYMRSEVVCRMMAVATSTDGNRVLRWMREQTKLLAMLAACKDQEVVKSALAELELPAEAPADVAAPRQPYHIGIHASCETPLAHGSDSKAGNATLFRRIDVLGVNGSHMTLPYYSGNAVRGQLRDLLADHLLTSLGITVDRSNPSIALWFFYLLYSGGALEEKSKAMDAITKDLGNHGAIRSDGIRRFRQTLPSLSLLGCAVGNRVLAGHMQCADLRPVCKEWGTGDKPIAEMLTWEFLTRREDHEDHAEHHGMIANTECLRAGAELEGGIDTDSAIPDMELSALGRGLTLLAKRGMLGAENRRGLGRVNIELRDVPDPTAYDEFLATRKDEIREYLENIGALPK